MIKTKTVQTFNFQDLSEKAKENAIEQYRNNGMDYPWQSENADVLKKFCDIFNVSVKAYDYGDCSNDINYKYYPPESAEDLTGVRLATYIYNNYYNEFIRPKYLGTTKKDEDTKTFEERCLYSKISKELHLTGYCMEYDILQPIIDFLQSPKENKMLTDLINDCLYAWLNACNKDYEYLLSNECIAENIEINEYDFDCEGNII